MDTKVKVHGIEVCEQIEESTLIFDHGDEMIKKESCQVLGGNVNGPYCQQNRGDALRNPSPPLCIASEGTLVRNVAAETHLREDLDRTINATQTMCNEAHIQRKQKRTYEGQISLKKHGMNVQELEKKWKEAEEASGMMNNNPNPMTNDRDLLLKENEILREKVERLNEQVESVANIQEKVGKIAKMGSRWKEQSENMIDRVHLLEDKLKDIEEKLKVEEDSTSNRKMKKKNSMKRVFGTLCNRKGKSGK